LKIIACNSACCCGEKDCFIPIPPNTVIAINVETFHKHITNTKSITPSRGEASRDKGGQRPHCDCILVLRVDDCPTHLVAVVIELKNLLGFLANYIAAQIISKTGLGVVEKPKAEFIYKLRDKMNYCANLIAKLLQPLHTTNNLTILCSTTIQYNVEPDNLISMVQNLVYEKTGKEASKFISIKLVVETVRKIASEIREALKAGCRAAQKQGIHINTMLMYCNVDVGTLLKKISEVCRER